jgi:hypothetical protein
MGVSAIENLIHLQYQFQTFSKLLFWQLYHPIDRFLIEKWQIQQKIIAFTIEIIERLRKQQHVTC